jgi:putative glutamine amidotransferase
MSQEAHSRPRVGIPYRTVDEEVTGKHGAYEKYLRAVEDAAGEPVEISLSLSKGELDKLAQSLDAVVLPGSPRDVNPTFYREPQHPKTAEADARREQTDMALLKHAFDGGKPVLAICYGIQLLNVYLGGTLRQDIASEALPIEIEHEWDRKTGDDEPYHLVHLASGSRLAQLADAVEVEVNSSHHQAIREPGSKLRISARAPDGVIEAVELTGDSHWVTGVQWHPERMFGDDPGDALSRALFRELVAAARGVHVRS